MEHLVSRVARLMASPWLAVPAAALGYGLWVAWLHRGQPDWWLPAAAHGLYAALITAVFHRIGAFLWQRWRMLRHSRVRVFASLSLLLVALPLFTQLASGSRAPILAILPGVIIGHGYLVALVTRLAGERLQPDADVLTAGA